MNQPAPCRLARLASAPHRSVRSPCRTWAEGAGASREYIVPGPNAFPPRAWWVRIAAPPRAITAARAISAAIAMLAVCGAVGCAGTRREVFPAISPPIVWPPPPDTPRIQYVGALTGDSGFSSKEEPGASGGLRALRAIFEGPRPPTEFASPIAVAVRGERVAVADPSAAGGAVIYVLDIAAKTFETWRKPDAEGFSWPIDVAWCGESLAVADSKRCEVLMLDSGGRRIAAIDQNSIGRPTGLAWDPAKRELYIADAGRQNFAVFSEILGLRRRIGEPGAAVAQFNRPTGVAVGVVNGERAAVVADAMNFRVQVVKLDSAGVCAIGRRGDAAGDFSLPRDVALDSAGHIYVLDNQFENVQVFDGEGRLLMAFGEQGGGPGQFNLPSGIAIDERDRIWVADTYNRRVQVFQYLRETGP